MIMMMQGKLLYLLPVSVRAELKLRFRKKIYTSENLIMAQTELSEAALKFVNELELDMLVDMYNRMTQTCQRKCISERYKDPDLSKGEAVCIDRCVAKYLEVHDRIGRKLTALSQQDEATMKKLRQQMQQTPENIM